VNDEIQQTLEELTPYAAPPSLRREVLAAVDGALNARPSWLRRHRAGLAVAASVLLAVALNWAVATREDRLQAGMPGTLPASGQVAAARRQSTSDAIEAMQTYHEMIIHLANSRGTGDVKAQEGIQMDRDRPRPVGGDRTSDQRHFGVAERLPA
jgi:hypothetical protein